MSVAGRCPVKVCGVTTAADAELACELGAAYVGLNFYPPSPRYVELGRAREIAAAVRGRACLVGVFVNAPRARVDGAAATVPLDLLQFHGDEGPEELRPFAGRAIKVFRVAGGVDGAVLADYPGAAGFLFERRHAELYGGSGESWAYGGLAGVETDRTLFVAGGIAPANARQALEQSGADVVDVCSGVESAPGRKDPEAMRRLFDEVSDVQRRG